ncbi:MAG TPA: M67 family metallopeptidase [Anaerolineales bacterium]|nr:M67 family metallopeptidase [Anaerolineales bacterium]
MTLRMDPETARAVHAIAEAAYPAEGAGLLLGRLHDDGVRRVTAILPLENRWEAGEQTRRYRLDPIDLLEAEDEAERSGLTILGVFHSHPDHPARPSAFDLDRALPFYSYLITSVESGVARESRSWRLRDDRGAFIEETVLAESGPKENA